MFTGIIEETGKISVINRHENGCDVKITCAKVLNGVKLGDSIAINGCCQTVVDFGKDFFTVNMSDETLRITTFRDAKIANIVNLERALMLSDRLGGHIVQGHVDGIAKFLYSEKLTDFYDLFFEVNSDIEKYIVKKGSIALNGVSLTVNSIENNELRVSIIPHTYENTNLKYLRNGDFVNLEPDILGRYIEKFLCWSANKVDIDDNFLFV